MAQALKRGGGGPTKPTIIAIKVSFTLNTPDGLRRVAFGLEKDTKVTVEDWIITFQLFERRVTTDPFGDAIVSLNVEVDQALHSQAEIAAITGLTPPQTAHATGPAAMEAKAAKAGQIPLVMANKSVQGTLKA